MGHWWIYSNYKYNIFCLFDGSCTTPFRNELLPKISVSFSMNGWVFYGSICWRNWCEMIATKFLHFSWTHAVWDVNLSGRLATLQIMNQVCSLLLMPAKICGDIFNILMKKPLQFYNFFEQCVFSMLLLNCNVELINNSVLAFYNLSSFPPWSC